MNNSVTMLLLVGLFLTACQEQSQGSSDAAQTIAHEIVVRDVQEIDVCDFVYHKYMMMKRKTELMEVAGTSLLTATSDIVVPVDLAFVGKVNMQDGIVICIEADGTYTASVNTELRLAWAKPDYKESERMSRYDWFDSSAKDNRLVHSLVSDAIDSILENRSEYMLRITDDHARTSLMPILMKSLGLHGSESNKINFHFTHRSL